MPENTDPWVSCSNFTVSILNPRVCKFKFSVGQESMGTDLRVCIWEKIGSNKNPSLSVLMSPSLFLVIWCCSTDYCSSVQNILDFH